MRIETKHIEIFKFNELTDSQKEKALDNLFNINVDDDFWWSHIYEDAAEIKCTLESFDIDRGSYCKLNIDCASTTINTILQTHGENCETYAIASKYKDFILNEHGEIDEFHEREFKKELQEEYLAILRREYEYLTSKEAIIETIESNDYEFTNDGKLY